MAGRRARLPARRPRHRPPPHSRTRPRAVARAPPGPLLILLAALAAGLLLAETPLPEGNAYVRALVGKQRDREAAVNDYTYDTLFVQEDMDGDGRVKKTRTRLYETFFVKGRPVRKLVAEDGRPLSPKRQAEEDRKAREQAEAIAHGRVATEQAGARLSQVLERYEFRAVGREEIAGRTAIVLEFQPRPGKRALDHDQVLRSLAGRIWVDESEEEVVRAELRNTAPLKFVGGLGASLHTVESRMEFRKVDDRVWLPARDETLAAGRILLLKKFRTRVTQTYSRYRRFQVESEEVVR